MDETTIRGLSLWQPWASLVAAGIKQIETRPWDSSWRGDLLICSNSGYAHRPPGVHEALRRWATEADLRRLAHLGVPAGCALAVVRLYNVTTTFDVSQRRHVGKLELACGDYSEGRFAWELTDLRVLKEPYPIKGRQRLWRIKPDDLEQIRLLLPSEAA